MATASTKGDSTATAAKEALDVVRAMQQRLQHTEIHLQKVEDTSRVFGETQLKIDEKVDGIYKLLTQWNSCSEIGSAQRSPHPLNQSSSPPHQDTIHQLSSEELATLKKQEAQGKILLHTTLLGSAQVDQDNTGSDTLTFGMPDTHTLPHHGFVYTHTQPENQYPSQTIFRPT
jgi:hypothetical protein